MALTTSKSPPDLALFNAKATELRDMFKELDADTKQMDDGVPREAADEEKMKKWLFKHVEVALMLHCFC